MKDTQNLMRLSAHFPWKVFSQVWALLHLEFRELFVVDEPVALLLSVSPLSIFTFAFFSLFSSSPPSLSLVGNMFLVL
jgi:hypothetical protein